MTRFDPGTASFDEGDLPVRLWPARRISVMNLIGSIVCLGCGPALLIPGAVAVHERQCAEYWWIVGVGIAITLCAIVLLVGCFRLSIRLESGRAVVFGYLGTTRVDRSRISMVTHYPSLRWTTVSGRRRNTYVCQSVSARSRKDRVVLAGAV